MTWQTGRASSNSWHSRQNCMPVPFVPGPHGPHVCDTPSKPLLQDSPSPTLPPSVPACQTSTNLIESCRLLSHGRRAPGVIWRLVVAAIGRLLRAGFDLIYLVSLGPARLLVRGRTRPADRQDRQGRPLPSQAHLWPTSATLSATDCHPLPHPDRAVTATRLMSRDKSARPVWSWSNPLRPRPSLFHARSHRELPPCACFCAWACVCVWRPLARGRLLLHLTYMP